MLISSARSNIFGKTQYYLLSYSLIDIKQIIPNVDSSGSFATWVRIAYDEISWNKLVNTIGLESPQSSEKLDGSDSSSPNSKAPSSPSFSSTSLPPPSPGIFVKVAILRRIGLDFTTNKKEVTTKYKLLAKIYHPDKFNDKKII